jgi:hypothetical protein
MGASLARMQHRSRTRKLIMASCFDFELLSLEAASAGLDRAAGKTLGVEPAGRREFALIVQSFYLPNDFPELIFETAVKGLTSFSNALSFPRQCFRLRSPK